MTDHEQRRGLRSGDETAPDQATRGDTRAVAIDRIAAKIERLSPQRRALRKALHEFGDDFDAKRWAEAFISPEADEINRVHAVTGGYLALVNNTMEAMIAGARLAKIQPAEGTRGASGILEAIFLDGGFTEGQAATFTELYHTRNRLQHASPDVEADELRRQVRLLLRHLPPLIKNYIDWLRRHDIEL